MNTKSVEKPERFNSLVEVLEDAKCSDFINIQLDKIQAARSSALLKVPRGAKLKKGPYDFLGDKGILHPAGLIEEFKLIDQKKSSLSAAARSLVTDICLHSMQETIIFWQQIDDAPKVKKPRSKKKSAIELTPQ